MTAPSPSIASHVRSLFWIALFVAVILGVAIITELVLIDFIHGNPHRTRENVIHMMFLFPAIFSVISLIGVFLVFTIPQVFQAILASVFGMLLALPITAIITWYCYDYLTPTDFNLGINVEADWAPYKHGLTMQRYFATLAAQSCVTVFTVLYCSTSPRISKKSVVLAVLILAIIAGIILGCKMAKGQLQFL